MKRIHLILAVSIGVILASCKNDDDAAPEVINEEETITTVNLKVTESGETTSQTYTWKDKTADKITLKANTKYEVEIEFLDESNPSDVEDITEEVVEERDEHFVFYDATTISGATIVSASNDIKDGDSIGINIFTTLSTGDAATGTLKAFLIHEPTKKTGTSRDDFGGETDIEVDFEVEIN
ncbi:type 1 periplasmic binding fold superfamily protein [Aquimarina sp. 2201CG1-2-11]|uniref:type 1 periplasmic binding fold superfamily protein n=1 Tax=Aquimarina discodermiae TaxID=3231043 RepID=UPI003461874D